MIMVTIQVQSGFNPVIPRDYAGRISDDAEKCKGFYNIEQTV